MDMPSQVLGNEPIMSQREACKGLPGHQRGVSAHQWKDFIIVLTILLTFEKPSTWLLKWPHPNFSLRKQFRTATLNSRHLNIFFFLTQRFISYRVCSVSWTTMFYKWFRLPAVMESHWIQVWSFPWHVWSDFQGFRILTQCQQTEPTELFPLGYRAVGVSSFSLQRGKN